MSGDLGMRGASPVRRLAALFCVLLVLLLALTENGAIHPYVILVILCLLIAILAVAAAPHLDEQNHAQQGLNSFLLFRRDLLQNSKPIGSRRSAA
jgi:hypothetical protein